MKRELSFSGTFYPGSEKEIKKFIENNREPITKENNLKGLILPHAGWIYSGVTALKGYSFSPNENIDDILLIGPSHRVPFKGVASSTFKAYKTLTGEISINESLIKELEEIIELEVLDQAHNYEHSLEVQLEFIKEFYPNANIVPLVVGSNAQKKVEKILNITLNRPNTLTILSSDLSHYLSYSEAITRDRETIKKIEDFSKIIGEDACGAILINAFTSLNKNKDFIVKLFDYRNSGDTAGDKKAVVGYAAMGIYHG
ncbi:MAG: AmmeMemoRadiSam system protein B [Spirochaetaceae bacterium]